ncbi:hypothetical protein [Pedobacter sp. AJM]|uniref:hypothetical protein n=1 Tax=Pedobacter sp. AJM TaxID=2003629 RepID=UPI000B4B6412|nr:hypothetical protein [Pedobacter sp. AJM]OWK69383.1 hypothetical protein CBW18_16315 [Pedobacter sp. AJM]
MLNERDKQRQRRHRKRFEARIDASAMVIAINSYCLKPALLNMILAMLGELPDRIRSRIHLYGIDHGEEDNLFKDLDFKSYTKYGVPFHHAGLDGQEDLSAHYAAIDVLIVAEDNEPGLNAMRFALSAGCSVITKSKIADKINLHIKDRLKVIDQPCALALSGHIAALASKRRKFDCALASAVI